MANFCVYCGKPLVAGQPCQCRTPVAPAAPAAPTYTPTPAAAPAAPAYTPNPTAAPAPTYAPTYNPAPTYAPPAQQGPEISAKKLDADTVKGFWEKMKNRMGIGNPELNQGDAFETGKKIVPECISANEGEVPVKQYTVAKLRNRVLGIPYTTAMGKLQVTNKRVIFRAPGRCMAGRTTLQHEFAVDELAGIEARREYVFNGWDLLFGMIVAFLGGTLILRLMAEIFSSGMDKTDTLFAMLLMLGIGVGGCIPFFTMKKRWYLKMLCLGASLMTLSTWAPTVSRAGKWQDVGFYEFIGDISGYLVYPVLACFIFALLVNAIKPNLVLSIKTKSALGAIDIRRRQMIRFSGRMEDGTGYGEVLPLDDAERCIREVNAVITDIQKLGDFGIEKWKA